MPAFGPSTYLLLSFLYFLVHICDIGQESYLFQVIFRQDFQMNLIKCNFIHFLDVSDQVYNHVWCCIVQVEVKCFVVPYQGYIFCMSVVTSGSFRMYFLELHVLMACSVLLS
jgi:hypothetical protein